MRKQQWRRRRRRQKFVYRLEGVMEHSIEKGIWNFWSLKIAEMFVSKNVCQVSFKYIATVVL